MKRNSIYILLFIIVLSGCTVTMKEYVRGIVGDSTKELEENKKDALKKTFTCDYNTCYNNVLETLKRISAYIYTEDKAKNLIAIYVSEQDTTPVGVFLNSVDAVNTEVEISSASAYAKEIISKAIFSDLTKLIEINKKEKGEPENAPEPVQD